MVACLPCMPSTLFFDSHMLLTLSKGSGTLTNVVRLLYCGSRCSSVHSSRLLLPKFAASSVDEQFHVLYQLW
jgi:hypothetical protein